MVPGNTFHMIVGIFINTRGLRLIQLNLRINPNVALGKRIIENKAHIPNNHRPFIKFKVATLPFKNNPIKKTR
jgi:hypothetical protein